MDEVVEEPWKVGRWHRDIEAVTGIVKVSPHDFVVKEVSLYEPDGRGEHLLLYVEKVGLSTLDMLERFGKIMGLAKDNFGYAGLKDRRARTQQWISLPAKCESRIHELEGEDLRILEVSRHSKKLRLGDLKENHFAIKVYKIPSGEKEKLAQLLVRVEEKGFPNAYGLQRFGFEGQTFKDGLTLLRGGPHGDFPRKLRDRRYRRLALNSVQSAIFNRCLSSRMDSGGLVRTFEGEVMLRARSGSPMVVTDTGQADSKLEAGNLLPAGPMWGPKMRPAQGPQRLWEEKILQEFGLSLQDFTAWGKLLLGTRRPYISQARDLSAQFHGDYLGLNFSLAPGAYGTVLLNEFGFQPKVDAP